MKKLIFLLPLIVLVSCENFRGLTGPQGEKGEKGAPGVSSQYNVYEFDLTEEDFHIEPGIAYVYKEISELNVNSVVLVYWQQDTATLLTLSHQLPHTIPIPENAGGTRYIIITYQLNSGRIQLIVSADYLGGIDNQYLNAKFRIVVWE